MRCPNCGQLRYTGISLCSCTWDEMLDAMRIVRQREAERRRRNCTPTVVEQEAERVRRG